MRKSYGETILTINELNKMLPSYLIDEVEEDKKNNIFNDESIITNFSKEKVSLFLKLILNYIFRINYFYRIQIKLM